MRHVICEWPLSYISINDHFIFQLVKKSNSFPFVESIRRSVVCPLMPWRCRGGDYDVEEENKKIPEPEIDIEQAQKIFQIAACNSPTVITKSPKPKAIGRITRFDDVITSNER